MINHFINSSGVHFELVPSAEKWASSATEALLPLAARILEDCNAFEIDTSVPSITLPNKAIAAWPENVAMLAGLPPNCPFGLDLRLSNGLGQAGTTLSMRWLKPGTSLPVSTPPSIDGLIVKLGEKQFRLQDPFFTVIKQIDLFNEAGINDPQEQLRIWSQIRNTLGEENVTSVTDN